METEIKDTNAPVKEGEAETETEGTFESVKDRLEEIAQLVGDESLPLDAALDLYEEAITLGLQASDLLEVGIVAPDDEEPEEGNDGIADGEAVEASGPEDAAAEGATVEQTAEVVVVETDQDEAR